MLHKVKAIVLQQIRFGETSVIIKAYTDAFGLQTYILNGVRKTKTQTRQSMLHPLSLLDMVVYHQEHRDINRIKELSTGYLPTQTPFNVIKSTIAIFLSEVLLKSIKEEESNDNLFSFLSAQIMRLDNMKAGISEFHMETMIRLAAYLGFALHGEWSEAQPVFDLESGTFLSTEKSSHHYLSVDASQGLSKLMKSPDAASQMQISHSLRKEILDGLATYYKLHIHGFGEIRSLPVLHSVFQ